MQLSGREVFEATPALVWETALSPEVLEQCLPGARSVEVTECGYRGSLERAIASIRTEMDLHVSVAQNDRPDRIVCEIEGEDEETASTVDGRIRIDVTESEAGEAELSYEMMLTVTGRLSSLGPRLLKRQLTNDLRVFFDALGNQIEQRSAR